jgi:hypothetical protein
MCHYWDAVTNLLQDPVLRIAIKMWDRPFDRDFWREPVSFGEWSLIARVCIVRIANCPGHTMNDVGIRHQSHECHMPHCVSYSRTVQCPLWESRYVCHAHEVCGGGPCYRTVCHDKVHSHVSSSCLFPALISTVIRQTFSCAFRHFLLR